MKKTLALTILLFPFLSGMGCGEPNIGFAPLPFPPSGHFDRMPPGFENNQAAPQEIHGRPGSDRIDAENNMNAQTEKTITDLIIKEAAEKPTDAGLARLAKRIKEGESFRTLISPRPFPDRMSIHEMGPIPVIGGIFIPFAAIIGICFVFVLFLRLRHRRDVLLIEKGRFRSEDMQGFRVDAALIVAGTILFFWGISLSIFNLLLFGVNERALAAGIIPFIVGIGCFAAFVLFRFLISHTHRN